MANGVIGWTDIPVVDLDRAVAFYSAVLGAEVVKHSMNDVTFGLLPHDARGPSGCLAPTKDNQPSRTGPLVYLSVDGHLDEVAAVAASRGGEVLQPKHPISPYGLRAVIVDSEGNRIALHSPTP